MFLTQVKGEYLLIKQIWSLQKILTRVNLAILLPIAKFKMALILMTLRYFASMIIGLHYT